MGLGDWIVLLIVGAAAALCVRILVRKGRKCGGCSCGGCGGNCAGCCGCEKGK